MSLEPLALNEASRSCKLSSRKLNLFVPTLQKQTQVWGSEKCYEGTCEARPPRKFLLAVARKPRVKYEDRVQLLAILERF